jgi:hypothetical protein
MDGKGKGGRELRAGFSKNPTYLVANLKPTHLT